MEDLVATDKNTSEVEAGAEFTYDYFVCLRSRQNPNQLIDLDAEDEAHRLFEIADNVQSDKDSEDSNRESAECNDYPDEDEDDSYDRGCGGYDGSSSSDEDRHDRGRMSDGSDIDEEEAARRYNRKHGA